MLTVSIFRSKRRQAIRLPKEYEFHGTTELTIEKQGDTILLRPVWPSWTSFSGDPRADANFLSERPDLIEAGRFPRLMGNHTRRSNDHVEVAKPKAASSRDA
jgi:antitoxin VapB